MHPFVLTIWRGKEGGRQLLTSWSVERASGGRQSHETAERCMARPRLQECRQGSVTLFGTKQGGLFLCGFSVYGLWLNVGVRVDSRARVSGFARPARHLHTFVSFFFHEFGPRPPLEVGQIERRATAAQRLSDCCYYTHRRRRRYCRVIGSARAAQAGAAEGGEAVGSHGTAATYHDEKWGESGWLQLSLSLHPPFSVEGLFQGVGFEHASTYSIQERKR